MKTLMLAFTLCLFFSCKKNGGTEVDPGTITPPLFYENACPWNEVGKPNCLLQPDTITSELLSFINTTLKEGKDLRTTNPSLMSSSAIADIAITQPSDVFVTYVFAGTGARNAFAFYTFPTNQPPKSRTDIKKITYVFPSVGLGTPLVGGDKVKIGRFNAGTSIGFVLLQDSWNPVTKKPSPDATHFFTNDILNPETDVNLKEHAVLINYAPENKIIIGYEDAIRSDYVCDHDFNDVTLYATVK